MATAAVRDLIGDSLDLVPRQVLWIEHEDVVEGGSGEAETTMATLDVDLALEEDGSHVGAGCRGTAVRGGVLDVITLIANAEPFFLRNLVDPGVI